MRAKRLSGHIIECVNLFDSTINTRGITLFSSYSYPRAWVAHAYKMREQFIHQERHADRSLQFLLLPSSGLFYLKVTNMLKTEPSERNIPSILPNCNVSCKQPGHSLGFMKSSGATRTDAAMTPVSIYCKNIHFENRKRRPQERGRKKRRKGKWNPIDRLWNRMNSKNCSSNHLLQQD